MGLVVLLAALGGPVRVAAAGPDRPVAGALERGRELFAREWKPDDPRCHGGDGLGPVYNETSCVACHGLGGPGGAGPVGMNVEAITAVGGRLAAVEGRRRDAAGRGLSESGAIHGGAILISIPGLRQHIYRGTIVGGNVDLHFSTDNAQGPFRDGFIFAADGKTFKSREFDLRTAPDGNGFLLSCAEGSIQARSFTLKPDEDALGEVHPGLLAAPTAMIHHHGVAPGYENWRARLMARVSKPRAPGGQAIEIPGGRIIASERNSPPLFGLGLIDALPDTVLLATAEQEPPQVRGRASRMSGGRVGRFGWKAQTADLREFVLAACAGELGLEVPGHPQSIDPMAPGARAKAPDLTAEESDALVAYVRSLPAPIRLAGPDPRAIEAGRQAFEAIGCADCHRPSLGGIDGIYSDLLLHDMGPDLVSVTVTGYYSPDHTILVPTSSSMADGTEWRTPPLWGYRESGPYLHDGRAEDLSEVVKAHKGQALDSAGRFFHLPGQRRSQIEQFLNSLAAPAVVPGPEVVEAKDPTAPRRSMLGPPASRRAPGPALADVAARAEEDRLAASRLGMGRALERMGKPEGALVFYREILRDQPDSEAARTAAARIEALGGAKAVRKAR